MQIEIGRVFTIGNGHARRTTKKFDQSVTYEFLIWTHMIPLQALARFIPK
jgi:hypothetical protein